MLKSIKGITKEELQLLHVNLNKLRETSSRTKLLGFLIF